LIAEEPQSEAEAYLSPVAAAFPDGLISNCPGREDPRSTGSGIRSGSTLAIDRDIPLVGRPIPAVFPSPIFTEAMSG